MGRGFDPREIWLTKVGTLNATNLTLTVCHFPESRFESKDQLRSLFLATLLILFWNSSPLGSAKSYKCFARVVRAAFSRAWGRPCCRSDELNGARPCESSTGARSVSPSNAAQTAANLRAFRRFGRMINSSGRAIIRSARTFLYCGASGTAIQSSHHVERCAFSF